MDPKPVDPPKTEEQDDQDALDSLASEAKEFEKASPPCPSAAWTAFATLRANPPESRMPRSTAFSRPSGWTPTPCWT